MDGKPSTLVVYGGALAALVVWYVLIKVLAWLVRPRLPEPGPSTMELRDDPPAIVNLLVNRTGAPHAASSTLLDLSARGLVDLYQPANDPAATAIRATGREAGELAQYEELVLKRISDRWEPLTELAERPADGGYSWGGHVELAVRRDAVDRGLVTEDVPGLAIAMMFVSMFLACGLGFWLLVPYYPPSSSSAPSSTSSSSEDGGSLGWLGFAALGVGVVLFMIMLVVVVMAFSAVRYTSAGRAATRHWLGVARWLAAHESLADLPPAAVAVWDRYVPYGAALGVFTDATRVIDLDVGHRDILISRVTGTARTVRVTYPRKFQGFGVPPAFRLGWAVFVLLLFGALGWWAFSMRGWWMALAVVAAVQVLRASYRIVRSIVDLRAVSIVGEILTLFPSAFTPEGAAGRYAIVVDDGRGDHLRAWGASVKVARGFLPGDRVQLRGNAWSRYVIALEAVPGGGTPTWWRPPT